MKRSESIKKWITKNTMKLLVVVIAVLIAFSAFSMIGFNSASNAERIANEKIEQYKSDIKVHERTIAEIKGKERLNNAGKLQLEKERDERDKTIRKLKSLHTNNTKVIAVQREKLKDYETKSPDEKIEGYDSLLAEHKKCIAAHGECNMLVYQQERMIENLTESLSLAEDNYGLCLLSRIEYEGIIKKKDGTIKEKNKVIEAKSKGNFWRYFKGGVGGALAGILITLLIG